MDELQTPDFLSAVMEYLSKRPNAKVLMLVETQGGGFETLQNEPSFVWCFGMLEMGLKVIEGRLDECRNAVLEKEMRERIEKDVNSVRETKGEAN